MAKGTIPKIHMERIDPPIGLAGCEFRAVLVDKRKGPIGFGASPRAARRNLLDNLDDIIVYGGT